MHDDYVRIRGSAYEPPANAPLYVGTVPPSTLPHLERSVRWARDHHGDGGRTE
jgi:hypothetical protein